MKEASSLDEAPRIQAPPRCRFRFRIRFRFSRRFLRGLSSHGGKDHLTTLVPARKRQARPHS